MGSGDEIYRIIENAVAQGWRHDRATNGHHRLYSPDGKSIVTTAGTGSDAYRGFYNFRADMRRAGYQDATTSFGEKLREAQTDKESKMELTKADYARSILQQEPNRVWTGDALFPVMALQYPGFVRTDTMALLAQLTDQGELTRTGRGEYMWGHRPEKALKQRGDKIKTLRDKMAASPPSKLWTAEEAHLRMVGEFPDFSQTYAGIMLAALNKQGFIERVGNGQYRMTQALVSERVPQPAPTAPTPTPAPVPVPPPSGHRGRTVTLPLPGKQDVALLIPEDFDASDWDFIKPILEAYMTKLLS